MSGLVLQQLYEPEPAGAEPARAGPGSSSSRAEPWGAMGSRLEAAEPPQTAHWQLACTTVLLFTHSIAFWLLQCSSIQHSLSNHYILSNLS